MTEPRPATKAEVQDWLLSAREQTPPRKTDVSTLRQYMQSKSRRRWLRLQRDYAWIQEEMVKLGANPEDARWLL